MFKEGYASMFAGAGFIFHASILLNAVIAVAIAIAVVIARSTACHLVVISWLSPPEVVSIRIN
jgi:hypothetical protein